MYNKAVVLPFPLIHEHLWRQDRLYNLLVVIDYNMHPVRKAKGSAIFLHVQASPTVPTAGCVALDEAALRRLLSRIGSGTTLTIA